MGVKREECITSLSVAECGEVFRETTEAARGVRAKLAGAIGKTFMGMPEGFEDYFTPDDGPFAAIDEDPPDFTVGTHILKFYGGGQGEGTTVHMYVWNRGAHREILLISPHKLLGGARSARMLERFSKALSHGIESEPEVASDAVPEEFRADEGAGASRNTL